MHASQKLVAPLPAKMDVDLRLDGKSKMRRKSSPPRLDDENPNAPKTNIELKAEVESLHMRLENSVNEAKEKIYGFGYEMEHSALFDRVLKAEEELEKSSENLQLAEADLVLKTAHIEQLEKNQEEQLEKVKELRKTNSSISGILVRSRSPSVASRRLSRDISMSPRSESISEAFVNPPNLRPSRPLAQRRESLLQAQGSTKAVLRELIIKSQLNRVRVARLADNITLAKVLVDGALLVSRAMENSELITLCCGWQQDVDCEMRKHDVPPQNPPSDTGSRSKKPPENFSVEGADEGQLSATAVFRQPGTHQLQWNNPTNFFTMASFRVSSATSLIPPSPGEPYAEPSQEPILQRAGPTNRKSRPTLFLNSGSSGSHAHPLSNVLVPTPPPAVSAGPPTARRLPPQMSDATTERQRDFTFPQVRDIDRLPQSPNNSADSTLSSPTTGPDTSIDSLIEREHMELDVDGPGPRIVENVVPVSEAAGPSSSASNVQADAEAVPLGDEAERGRKISRTLTDRHTIDKWRATVAQLRPIDLDDTNVHPMSTRSALASKTEFTAKEVRGRRMSE